MKNCGGGISYNLKQFYKRISYSIWPCVVFVCFLLTSYYGNYVVSWFRGGEGASQFPLLPIDNQIPLVPWFVYFYYLTFPLGIVTFFYVAYASRKKFYDLFYTLIISFAISGVIYFFFQTTFSRPTDFVPESFTDKVLMSVWGSSQPINEFPSQHAFMAIAMILGCLSAGKNMKWQFKVFTILCAIMVVLSTFFIKQHFFLDWVASACIMIPTYFLVAFVRRKNEKKNAQRLEK